MLVRFTWVNPISADRGEWSRWRRGLTNLGPRRNFRETPSGQFVCGVLVQPRKRQGVSLVGRGFAPCGRAVPGRKPGL